MAGREPNGPDWERLLAAERHVQHPVPGAVLVGGTAAAWHVAHRIDEAARAILEARRDAMDAETLAWAASMEAEVARKRAPR